MIFNSFNVELKIDKDSFSKKVKQFVKLLLSRLKKLEVFN